MSEGLLEKIEAEIKTIKEASSMLSNYGKMYDALNKTMTYMIEGRLVMKSIGANDLRDFAMLMTEIKAALVVAQGGHRVGRSKVD